MPTILKHVCILGAGHVAQGILTRLHHSTAGNLDIQIWSRSPFKKEFETKWSRICKLTTRPSDIRPDADCYILSVKDDAIAEVVAWIKPIISPDACVLHCSGSVGLDVLAAHFEHAAVCYPYQTMALSYQRPEDFWQQLPWLLHNTTPEARTIVTALVRLLGPRHFFVDDNQRRMYHLAAVMANNFTNFIIGLSFDLLNSHQLDKNLLKPLLASTFANAQAHNPHDIQTGPAKRGDNETLAKHLSMLEPDSIEQQAYNCLSTLINKKHRS